MLSEDYPLTTKHDVDFRGHRQLMPQHDVVRLTVIFRRPLHVGSTLDSGPAHSSRR